MSTSKFRPSSKRNPCPLCDDISGKCRDNGDIYLCMPLGDTRVGEVVGQYKCIGNKNSGWATFKIDNSAEWSEEKRREWEDQKRHREQEKAREDKERRRRSLSAEERDKGYRLLLGQLELHSSDRADLLRRGFSEQEIEAHGFKSVVANQKLSSPLSPALPGITTDGWRLAVSGEGYLCPTASESGLIVGMQIRLRNPSNGNRYRWVSSKNATLPLPNGENPLGFYQLSTNPTNIALVDSLGAKPWLAAKTLNAVVIGAAGGQFLSSHQQLLRYLEVATAATKCDQINIYPDAGDVQNRQVIWRLRGLKNFLAQHKYKVRFAWWGQISKQDNDIDEGVDPSQIEYLSWPQFDTLAEQYCEEYSRLDCPKIISLPTPEFDSTEDKTNKKSLPNKPSTENPPEQKEANDKDWKLWRKSRKFTADININAKSIYGNISPSESGTITLINSGLGTGKTYLSYQEIRRLDDYGWLMPGHRNNLLRQFAAESGFYHFQDELKGKEGLELLTKDPRSKITFAIDSIIHFKKPEDFDGKVLLIDEIQSVIEQLLIGNTAIKGWRARAKRLFEEAIKRADRVIAMDGHLSDSTADYLASLCDKKIVKIKNHYKGSCSNEVRLYIGTGEEKVNKNDRSGFLQHLLEEGIKQPFVIVSDSQKFLEEMELILKEAGLCGIRLDSNTSNQEWAQEFLNGASAPAQYILINKPDYFAYSPSAESGINVDIPGYFKNIYCNFFGVLTTNQQLQMIKRVRDSEATIHIFCSPKGFKNDKQSASSPDEIDEAARQYRIDCGIASLEGLDQTAALNKCISKLIEASNSPHYKRECQLRAIRNHELENLRACLKEALLESGYRVKECVKSRSESSKEKLKQAKEFVQDLVVGIKLGAPLISRDEADTLRYENSTKLDREQKAKIWKRDLVDRLPGIETAVLPVASDDKSQGAEIPIEPTAEETKKQITLQEPVPVQEPVPIQEPIPVQEPVPFQEPVSVLNEDFVKRITFTDKALISRIEDFYFIQNPEITKRFQQERWFKDLEKTFDSEIPELQITGYRSRWLKTKTLLDLGIDKFWQPEANWTNESPEAVALWEASKNKRTARATGFSVGKDSPATFVGKVLKALGFTTASKQVRQPDGSKPRIYSVTQHPLEDPVQAEIYRCVERREQARLAKLEVLDWGRLTSKIPPDVLQTASLVLHTGDKDLAGVTHSNPDTASNPAVTPGTFLFINKGAGVTNSESQSEDTRTDLERIVDAVEKCQSWREYQQIALSAGQETMADAWLFVENEQRRKIKQWEMAGLSDPIAIMQVPLVRHCA